MTWVCFLSVQSQQTHPVRFETNFRSAFCVLRSPLPVATPFHRSRHFIVTVVILLHRRQPTMCVGWQEARRSHDSGEMQVFTCREGTK